MKKILLVTLLSIAMSENMLMENYLRPRMAWIRDNQLWGRKVKRVSRNDIPIEMEEFSNYDDDRQRISNKRFINEARKLPSIAIIRETDVTQFPQIDLLSSEKSKLESVKPAVLISIDIQDRMKVSNNSQENCSAKKIYYKHNQNWQVQQPFYVEEPRWIDINVDYVDASPQHLNDPYILSRGKKFFRIKEPEEADRMIENSEKFLDYPNRNRRLLTKNRIRRSVDMNDKPQSKITDEKDNEENEINHYNSFQDIDKDTNNTIMKKNWAKSFKINKLYEGGKRITEKETNNISHNFIKKYEKDKLKNLTKRSLREFKNRIKKQKIQCEDIPNNTENSNSETAKIGQDKKLNNCKSHFIANVTDMNKRKKKSALLKNRKFPEIIKKYKARKINANSENVEKNETDIYEQIKNKAYVDELENLSKYDDSFVLSRGKYKLDDKTKSSDKKDTNRNESFERLWKIHYAHGKKFKSKEKANNKENESEINKGDIEMTADSQLTGKINLERSEINNYLTYRKKRNACQNLACKTEPLQDQWLKNIEREIQDLQRRDKHSDILDGLKLGEPYIISRGKKSSHEFENELYSVSKSRNVDNADRSQALNLLLMKSLLRILSMEVSKCDNDNCDVNANRLSSKLSPRARRSSLEEILAAYDPYYVARGKRVSPDNFPTKMPSLRNQKNV